MAAMMDAAVGVAPVFAQQYHIAGNALVRLHQQEAHAQLQDFFGDDRIAGVLVTACTGSGKTGTIAMAPLAVPGCRRVLVVCPNNDIANVLHIALSNHQNLSFLRTRGVLNNPQWAGGPAARYPDVVCLNDAMPQEQIYAKMVGADIVITTARFLAATDESNPLEMTFPLLSYLHELKLANQGPPLFDLIVFDEAQHSPAPTWRAIRSAVEVKGLTKVLFTTAARYRSDRQPLDYDRATREFRWIDGLLAQPDPCIKDFCFLELKGGSNNQRTLKQIDEASQLGPQYELPDGEVIMVVDAVARQLGAVRQTDGASHKAIIVVNQQPGGVNRAKYVAELIGNSGMQIVMGDGLRLPMRVAALHSELSAGERQVIMHRFHMRALHHPGCLDALVVVSTLGEGYDFPLVSVVGILRAYQSLAPFYQYAGRASRRILPEHVGQNARPDRADNVAHVITHEWLNQRRWFTLLRARQLVCHEQVPVQLDDAVQGVDEVFNGEVDGKQAKPGRGVVAPPAEPAEPKPPQIHLARLLLAPDQQYYNALREVVVPMHARWTVGTVQWVFHDE